MSQFFKKCFWKNRNLKGQNKEFTNNKFKIFATISGIVINNMI